MLHAHTVLSRDGVTVTDVACRHGRGRGETAEHTTGHGIVLVRRGCFLLEANGERALLDATGGYCVSPGDEQRYDHPHDAGDDCTSFFLVPELLAALWGGETRLPAAPLRTAPGVDVAHRVLVARARREADPHALVEQAVEVCARALETVAPGQVAAGRPVTARAHRALADGAREALAEDPDRSLPELARLLATSPHHLSRVFRAMTGHTVSRHRRRLRTRQALERLAGGERDLARLAGDVGFADQSHLSRALRAETGRTPGRLRHLLA